MAGREIKFRGKRYKHGDSGDDWVYGDFYHSTDERACIDQWLVKEKTVGQYTGLKDKNSVEIYEGDVIRRYEEVIDPFRKDSSKDYTLDDLFEVKYVIDHIGAHFLACNRPTSYYADHDYTTWIDVEHMEVIGNIHDNPELLHV